MMNFGASGGAKPFPVAFEDSSNESQAEDVPESDKGVAHPTNGNKSSPQIVMAVEDSSDEEVDNNARPGNIHNSGATVKAANTSSPRPSVVAVKDCSQYASTKKGENEKPLTKPQESGSNTRADDTSQLELSLTEHHRKGGGILASQRELSMDPQEFAIGCNLLQAAARGDRDAMEKILKKYPNHVNFRDYDRRTALHVAASEGHLDICMFLVEGKRCRINRSDRWGGSPLDDAHRHRQENVVKFLRKNGATTGSLDQTTNLIAAAADGDAEEVGLLLNMCTNKHIDSGDYDKRTALHLAAGEGRLEIVRLLCEAGADVNVKDRWGGRPLDDAKRNRHDDVADYLESLGGETGDPHEGEDGDAKKILEEEDDNMRVEFTELEMIERIGESSCQITPYPLSAHDQQMNSYAVCIHRCWCLW